jgi:hypothetical protein
MNNPIKSIYIIGSLRNETIPRVGRALRAGGVEVFDDWYAAGPEADDYWKAYEQQRGRTYTQALRGRAARNVFAFDRFNLDRCDAAVLVLPAGRSGHLELGYAAGRGKQCFILLPDEHDRWDVMYAFADDVFQSVEELLCRVCPIKKTSSVGPITTGSFDTNWPSTGIAPTITK